MEEINGVFKEMFHQPADEGIPAHWVVFYWPDDCNPAWETHKAEYFSKLSDAENFKSYLSDYDDWYTSQEEPLAVQ